MPISVLIPPDNRLLGWSLSDLTLYGAQPVSGVSIGRAANGDAAIAPSADQPVSPATPAPSESELAAGETAALLDHGAASPPVPATAWLAGPVADHASAAADSAPTSVPQPVGSGSFVEFPVPHSVQGAPAADGVAPTDAVATMPDGLSNAATESFAGHALDAAGTTIDTVISTLGSGDLIPAGVDVASLAGAALDLTPISAFGGSDPAAGLQTLIGMVDSTEAFDIGHVTSVAETAPGSILDALAADEAPSSLLGDEGEAGHHGLDDHGLHLGA